MPLIPATPEIGARGGQFKETLSQNQIEERLQQHLLPQGTVEAWLHRPRHIVAGIVAFTVI